MITCGIQRHTEVSGKHSEVDPGEQRYQSLDILTVCIVKVHFLPSPSDPIAGLSNAVRKLRLINSSKR